MTIISSIFLFWSQSGTREIVRAIGRIFAVKLLQRRLIRPPDIGARPRPWPRIVFRVIKGGDDLQRPVALLRALMHFANTIRELGVGRGRRSGDVQPKPLLEAAGLHHQGVAVPMRD